MKRAVAALPLLVLAACGGNGSPSQPTAATPAPSAGGWPAGAVVDLVSGDTGAAVEGPITIAGVAVQAGTPLKTPVAPTATVDVVVKAFLNRQTLPRTGETRLSLWPDTAALPGEYTEALVYTEYDATQTPLRRLASSVRTVAVAPAAALQGDAAAMEALRRGVDAINTGSVPAGVRYVVGGAGELSLAVKTDQAAANCTTNQDWLAFTDTWIGGAGDITQAEVTFCSDAAARDPGTVAHELGHSFGLRHSSRHNDLMQMYAYRSRSATPTEQECLVMRLMRQRRSGTTWPDNDRNVQAQAARHVVMP